MPRFRTRTRAGFGPYTTEYARFCWRTNYKITGIIEPEAGQSFPRSWGRLVSYEVASNQYGNINEQRFVFEDEDGTIRIVKTDLNWSDDMIDDAEVITIGRN